MSADELEGLDPSRRAFIKRMAIGAAVAPVVASFTMAGLSSTPAFAQVPNTSTP
jgi:hypothetical protein